MHFRVNFSLSNLKAAQSTYSACMEAYNKSQAGVNTFHDGTSVWIDQSGVEVRQKSIRNKVKMSCSYERLVLISLLLILHHYDIIMTSRMIFDDMLFLELIS